MTEASFTFKNSILKENIHFEKDNPFSVKIQVIKNTI